MLQRFTAEVLTHGAEACLPRNLSKEWIDVLAHELCHYFKQDPDRLPTEENDDCQTLCCALAAIVGIMTVKLQRRVITFNIKELHDRFVYYRTELVLEALHRSNVISYEPATLETIFTDRNLTIKTDIFEK